jgi:uncharacterized protein (TIGR03083 family)
MRHALTDVYREERAELIALGRSLSDEQAATMTTACPEWSIKDVYAHLAGISTDIMSGNTENAATEAWADGHVADRLDRSLTDVLDEWDESGQGVLQTMEEAGGFFPFQLFVDQWTHHWDIRATLGDAARETPDLRTIDFVMPNLVEAMVARSPSGVPAITVSAGDASVTLGDGEPAGELALDRFEFARLSMGRRSQAQIDALSWPAGATDVAPYVQALVLWSVNEHDVIDPVDN